MMSEFICPTGRETECVLYSKEGKCSLCDGEMYFEAKKTKAKPSLRTQKKSGRMGAKFEDVNHEKNIRYFGKDNCFQTPNSGAGDIYKGDEWIKAFVTCMQECKTNVVPKTSRGSQTYTCKRSELEKVAREGKEAGVEFWYLKFRFLESDSDAFSVVSDDIMDALLVTINEDRKKARRADKLVDYYKARYEHLEVKNAELEAKIRELEAQIALRIY